MEIELHRNEGKASPLKTWRERISILATVFALVAFAHPGRGQTSYDANASVQLSEQINRKYGNRVSSSQPLTELMDIKNRLEKCDSIAQEYGVVLDYQQYSLSDLYNVEARIQEVTTIKQQYGVSLDYREYTILDLYNIEMRIQVADRINRTYGQRIDWAQFGFMQLLQMEGQLKIQAQAAKTAAK